MSGSGGRADVLTRPSKLRLKAAVAGVNPVGICHNLALGCLSEDFGQARNGNRSGLDYIGENLSWPHRRKLIHVPDHHERRFVRQPWVIYFLRALQGQKNQLETKIERERVILGDLPDLSVQILELAHAHGRVTISEAAKATGVSRNTIKDHAKKLVGKAHLARHGAGRGTWYSLP